MTSSQIRPMAIMDHHGSSSLQVHLAPQETNKVVDLLSKNCNFFAALNSGAGETFGETTALSRWRLQALGLSNPENVDRT